MARSHNNAEVGGRWRRGATDYAGWGTAAAGAVLCVLGWYGVSGERFAERQLPFLASATIPGAALIIAGAVLLSGRSADSATAARVAELHRLLVATPQDADGGADAEAEDGGRGGDGDGDRGGGQRRGPQIRPPPAAGGETGAGASGTAAAGTTPGGGTQRVAVPHGTVHHRPDCPLVEGKPEAREVDEAVIRQRGLSRCPVCGDGAGQP